MRRFAFCLIVLAALPVVSGCAAKQVLPGSARAFAPSYIAVGPDLNTHNYVATYPVAETPNYIAKGSDGNLWFTTASHVAQITTAGTESYFSNSGGFALHIAPGAPGALWFTNLNANIGKITTAGIITIFPISGASKTLDIARGPDGNMWFTEQGSQSIGKITAAGAATLYHVPSGANPIGITAGPDGNLWFSAAGGPNVQEFGKITTSGAITEFKISPGPPGSPGAMAKGPDGNLYSTNSNGGVYSVTTAGVATYYPTAAMSNFEDGVAVGPDKQIWISPGDSANDLTEFDPVKHVFSKAAKVPTAPFCSPGLTAIPRGLTQGPDGDMWFVTEHCAYVGAYEETVYTVGLRITGEASINMPPYGFELGYFLGTKSTTSQTVSLGMGETVQFQNVDTVAPHSASFLGDATVNHAPWPSSFNGSSTQSPAFTQIGTVNFSTGIMSPGKSSPFYETGMPGFYMFGCAVHYNPRQMRTVIIVH